MQSVNAWIVTGTGRSSEDEQRGGIEKFCEQAGLEVARWIESEPDRVLEAVLAGRKRGSANIQLVTYRNDLVAEDITEFYAQKGVLLENGVELILVREEFGGYKLYVNLFEKLVRRLAEISREKMLERIQGGRKEKAGKGGYIGGQPPMGYRVQNGKLVINEEEAEVVRFIMDRKRTGKTMLGTVNALNEAGYKTRKGGQFVISTVQSIWHNENVYRGMTRYGKNGAWVPGEQEPILKD